jgi:hypothetical protein
MGEGLRKVAELPPQAGMVFLGQEPDVVAHRQQLIEDPPRFGAAALEQIVVGEPEGARERLR